MKNLIADIKKNTFKPAYVFYGEEKYLVRIYEKKIREALILPQDEIMNLEIYEGSKQSIADVENALNTLPFMCEKRLIIWKDSKLFVSGKKDESERVLKTISNLPDFSVLVFIEEEIDKRIKLTKEFSKYGAFINFETPSENELLSFVVRELKKCNKTISQKNGLFFLRTVYHNLDTISSELEKLISFCYKKEEVTAEDIQTVCTKAPQTKIFDMIDAVATKNVEVAISIYHNLLVLKESPIMIIAMIARQFRFIMESKLLKAENVSPAEIAKITNQRPFVINECLKQADFFKIEKLTELIHSCADTDVDIKTGKIDDKMAVELLIIRACSV